MKRFRSLSIVLVLLLMLAVMPSAASANGNLPIFEAIGLNVPVEEGKTITRFDLAKIAISLAGLDMVKTGNSVYVDVPEKHWAFPEVNTVTYYGYMEGLADGTFGVDAEASIADGAQVVMNLLGYGSFAKQANWTIGEYLVRAKSIGLLNGVASSAGKLDAQTLKSMIVNMLDKNIVTITSVGTNGTTFDVDTNTTYLTSRYGYYFKEGTLQAVGKSSITGSSAVANGKVKVGGVIYSANGKDYSSFLGSEVRIIIDKNESNAKVLYMEGAKNSQNTELTISSKNIEGFSGTTLSYIDDEGKTGTASISLSSQIFLNGQKTTFDARLMQPLSGGLKLVDTNDDEEYDLVYVTYELFYEVSGAFEDEYIADAITGTKVDIKDIEFSCYENGITTGVNSIKNEMIISVMPGALYFDGNGVPSVNNSSTTKASVDIGVKKVSGIVTAKGTSSCVIDGIEYEYSKYYNMLKDNGLSILPELNKNVVAYLNSENDIVFVKLDVKSIVANQSFKYAYALKVARKSAISDTMILKLFTQDAEMLILETAEGYRFNGEIATADGVLSDPTLYPAATFNSQLITYELNDEGKVSAFDVAVDNTSSTEGYDILNFSVDFVAEGTTFRNTFEHLYSFKESSIMFEIPQNLSDEKKFKVKVTSEPLVNNVRYNASLYDVDDKYEAAVLVIDNSKFPVEDIRNLATNHFYGLNAFVVESKLNIIDDEGNERVEITGLTYSGSEMETKKFICVENDLTDADQAGYTRIYAETLGVAWKDLVPGDVIQYETNSYGEITRFRLVFREAYMKDAYGNVVFKTNGGAKWHTTYLVAGVVDKVFADGNFLFRSSATRNTATLHKASMTGAYTTSNVKIFIVENGKVRQGKASELRYDEAAFFICESGIVYDVIVYRD